MSAYCILSILNIPKPAEPLVLNSLIEEHLRVWFDHSSLILVHVKPFISAQAPALITRLWSKNCKAPFNWVIKAFCIQWFRGILLTSAIKFFIPWARVKIDHVSVTGVASLLPRELTALTLKVCSTPAFNWFVVKGVVQEENVLPSRLHWNPTMLSPIPWNVIWILVERIAPPFATTAPLSSRQTL